MKLPRDKLTNKSASAKKHADFHEMIQTKHVPRWYHYY